MALVIDKCHIAAGRSVQGLSQHRATIDSNFISENGIVAVFGDEDQFVKSHIRRIKDPLSKEWRHRFETQPP